MHITSYEYKLQPPTQSEVYKPLKIMKYQPNAIEQAKKNRKITNKKANQIVMRSQQKKE